MTEHGQLKELHQVSQHNNVENFIVLGAHIGREECSIKIIVSKAVQFINNRRTINSLQKSGRKCKAGEVEAVAVAVAAVEATEPVVATETVENVAI